MIELQFFFLQIANVVSGPNMKQYEVVTSTVCKNIVETFVTITLLLK